MRNLYTIVVEFGGETDISQFRASTPRKALALWAAGDRPLGQNRPPSEVGRQISEQLLNGDGPVPLEGCRNVWCISGVIRRRLILIHVSQTLP